MSRARRRSMPSGAHGDKVPHLTEATHMIKKGSEERRPGASRRRNANWIGVAPPEAAAFLPEPPEPPELPEPPEPVEVPGTPEKPLDGWSDAADYLRAAAREEAPSRLGVPAAPVDGHARKLWRTAFGLAVRRRFDADTPLAEITRTVAAAVHAHEAAGLPVIDAEMIVRAELGETVPLDELDDSLLSGIHLLLFASLVDELALGDGELDDLVDQAHRLAAAR